MWTSFRTFSVRRVDRVVPMISVDHELGPFPAESVVSPALHEAASRRLVAVRTALQVVVGDPSVLVVEPDERERVIRIREPGRATSFGLQIEVPDPDPDGPMQIEQDIDTLVDDLSETRIFCGRRLPDCPQHPDSHALLIAIDPRSVVVRCPATGEVIRTVQR